MNKYKLICKKGEGTFSEVLKAQSLKNQKYVAIKCMKNHFDSIDKVNNLREIQALRRLSPHPHVVKLYEVLYDQPTGRLALVFELMDMNIYELIRGRRHYLQQDRVKHFLFQLVKAMDHMHRNGIFHRDIKPENILISNEELKVADFGSCRGIYSKQPYTEYISTRWYRAPECLLTDGYYGYKMDMWGIGCVMFEVLALFPLFPGTNELDQIERIHNILGTPPKELLDKFKKHATHMDFNFADKKGTGIAKLIPHCSPECIDLIVKLLAYDPELRLSARQALRHPYFAELRMKEKQAKAAATASAKSTTSNVNSHDNGKKHRHSTTKASGTEHHSSKHHHGHHHKIENPTTNEHKSYNNNNTEHTTNQGMISNTNEKDATYQGTTAPAGLVDTSIEMKKDAKRNKQRSNKIDLPSTKVKSAYNNGEIDQVQTNANGNTKSETTLPILSVSNRRGSQPKVTGTTSKYKVQQKKTTTTTQRNQTKVRNQKNYKHYGNVTNGGTIYKGVVSKRGYYQSSTVKQRKQENPLPPIGNSLNKDMLKSKYKSSRKVPPKYSKYRTHNMSSKYGANSTTNHHHHQSKASKYGKSFGQSNYYTSAVSNDISYNASNVGVQGGGTRRNSNTYQSPYSQKYLKRVP